MFKKIVSYIAVMGETNTGNGCMIDPNVILSNHDHYYNCNRGISSGKSVLGSIKIGN